MDERGEFVSLWQKLAITIGTILVIAILRDPSVGPPEIRGAGLGRLVYPIDYYRTFAAIASVVLGTGLIVWLLSWGRGAGTITAGPAAGARNAPIIPEGEVYRVGGLIFFGFQEWETPLGAWIATLNVWNMDIVDYSRIDYTITLLDSEDRAVESFEGTAEGLLRGTIKTILLQTPGVLSGVVGFRVQISGEPGHPAHQGQKGSGRSAGAEGEGQGKVNLASFLVMCLAFVIGAAAIGYYMTFAEIASVVLVTVLIVWLLPSRKRRD
ncbi:MAG: hypothetical protein DDT20_01773 [Firmicutes bacterium]|nr:hypothetical protein [Bacillota bacterium]